MGLLGKTTQIIEHPRLGLVTFHRRKGSKNIRLSLSTTGNLRLSYPWYVSFAQAHTFLEKQESWALAALARAQQRRQNQPPPLSPHEVAALRQKAKATLLPRLAQLAQQHHFTYNKAFIKNNKTNWGSCSGANNINLNLKIVLLPDHLRDYVMLHELCHTRIRNHGPHFWALLNTLTQGNAKSYAKELHTVRAGFTPAHSGTPTP